MPSDGSIAGCQEPSGTIVGMLTHKWSTTTFAAKIFFKFSGLQDSGKKGYPSPKLAAKINLDNLKIACNLCHFFFDVI